MRDAAFDTGVIIADAMTLAELPGGTGHEQIRIDWPVLVRVDDVFGKA